MAWTAEQRKAYLASYYIQNRDRLKAQALAYHVEHRAERLEQQAVYREGRKELTKQESAEYRARIGKETLRAKGAEQYAKHRERILAQNAQYRATHQDAIRARRGEWLAAHPEHNQVKKAARRARRLSAERSDLTTAQWTAIKALYAYRCVYCGVTPKRLTQDHIIPLSKGGNHTVSNVVPACKPCNSRKWANPPSTPVQPALLV